MWKIVGPLRGFVVPTLVGCSFLFMILIYKTSQPSYFLWLNLINEHPFRTPFIDTRFVTAQVECWSRGIDVYMNNPCDPLGRLQDYSPLWLRLPFLAKTDQWTNTLGLTIDLFFLGSLFLIPWHTDTGVSLLITLCAVLSHATAFALERGNTDVLMFAMIVLFGHLLAKPLAPRATGYTFVLAAGLLKFYPLVLLALGVREKPRILLVMVLVSSLVMTVFILAFGNELSRIGVNMAGGAFGGMFGARGLLLGFGQILGYSQNRQVVVVLAVSGVSACVMMLYALRAITLSRDPDLRMALASIDRTRQSFLLVGSVLTVGCFFGHQNIDYRGIVLLLALPGVLALADTSSTPRIARLYRATSILVVMALWGGRLDTNVFGWLLVQLVWWWIVCIFSSIVVCMLEADIRRQIAVGRGIWTTIQRMSRALP